MKSDTPTHRLSLRTSLFVSAMILLTTFSAAPAVNAQSESGNAAIEGTVVDANGAAISGAAVVVRSVDTGLERDASTNSNGRFSVPVLPVGHYTVKVTAQGFGPAERTEISLRVG